MLFRSQQIDLQLPVPVLPRHADEDLPQQVPHDALRVHESPDRHEDRNLAVFANLTKNPQNGILDVRWFHIAANGGVLRLNEKTAN